MEYTSTTTFPFVKVFGNVLLDMSGDLEKSIEWLTAYKEYIKVTIDQNNKRLTEMVASGKSLLEDIDKEIEQLKIKGEEANRGAEQAPLNSQV